MIIDIISVLAHTTHQHVSQERLVISSMSQSLLVHNSYLNQLSSISESPLVNQQVTKSNVI